MRIVSIILRVFPVFLGLALVAVLFAGGAYIMAFGLLSALLILIFGLTDGVTDG